MVVSLALCIGAIAAIFTLIHPLFWRDLPVRDPERPLQLSESSLSCFTFHQLQARSGQLLDGVIATAAPGRAITISAAGP